jgi:hypothetical protein
MATIITETFYKKTNNKYDKETLIVEEDYDIDGELADMQTNATNASTKSAEWLAKKAALEAKKAAAGTRHV